MSSVLTRSRAQAPIDIEKVGHVSPPPRESVLSEPGPWRRRESLVAGVVAVIGLVGLVISHQGAADERYWREQLDWVSGATFSTVIVVLAVAGWIVVGMRRLRRGFAEVAARKNSVLGLDELELATVPVESGGDTVLVRVSPMTRVHRLGCLLLRGKSPVVVPAEQVDGYERCGVCRS